MSGKHDDIINLSRHISKNHPQMSIIDRAAQFMPFAALSGYAESINEAGRLVDKKKDLTEEEKEILNYKINYLVDNNSNINVMITYFVKDQYKDGGIYQSIVGVIKKINIENNYIQLEDKRKIYLDDIININSNIFEN